MSVNLGNVNYEEMPSQARQIRVYGKQLNTEISKAYKSVEEMHNYWYGKRYNELVKIFNELIPNINDILNLVVCDIPKSLENIANNYSLADRGQKVTTVSDEGPNKIVNISVCNDIGMKFVESNVFSTKKQISTNFKNAKEQMNKLESEYKKIKWSSDASQAFETKFEKLKTNIVLAFENIDTEFTKLMTQTQQDMENTEKANTVS